MSLPNYENVEKSKILYILTHPTSIQGGIRGSATGYNDKNSTQSSLKEKQYC